MISISLLNLLFLAQVVQGKSVIMLSRSEKSRFSMAWPKSFFFVTLNPFSAAVQRVIISHGRGEKKSTPSQFLEFSSSEKLRFAH